MPGAPLISIVVPSYNQAAYIRETLQSLLDQRYPMLEVVIQDGDSTDGAAAIAEEFVARHPDIFQLFVERDSGQANAINRGFARTRGEIMGFLNSDDTLLPGALEHVARAIDPARDRLVVFGRCLYTGDTAGLPTVEHPAEYFSHFEQLAIWKRGINLLPQPSVFWHRRVWETCGGLDEDEHHALDYDLFCRFSRRFRFHEIDEVLSTYRLHSGSKSAQRSHLEVLDLSIAVSRKHWGPRWRPLYWRCTASHWWHDRRRIEQARKHLGAAIDCHARGKRLAGIGHFFQACAISPRVVWIDCIRPGRAHSQSNR